MCAAMNESSPTWKVCARKFNTSKKSKREIDLEVWSNLSVKSAEKLDCDGDTYKYYDQLINELYDEGYRVFINEIGRGKDTEINNIPYYFNQDGESELKDISMCLIVFGNYENDSYNELRTIFPKLKIINAEFYFDDKFTTQFVEWFDSYENNKNILMEFIDMTQGNVNSSIEILKTCKVGKNILRISEISYQNKLDYGGKVIGTEKIYKIFGMSISNFFSMVSRLSRIINALYNGGRYYKKYLKYKAKYLKLKYSF
jgi:hypothetical protein